MSSRQLDRAVHHRDWGDDDTDCNILHVDMDAFFAAVEVRDRPELKGLPVIVGRAEGRGVVLSATYEARAMGIHSAMPMGMARRQCPNAVYVEPTRQKYLDASEAVMALLGDMTPMVEVVSVDEAFLDVRGVRRAVGTPAEIASRIRSRVSAELGLTCSVGIATVTMVAKVASTMAKPNGVLLVPANQTIPFLHELPIGRLWGVGQKTEKQLMSLGIVTVGDLAAIPERRLQHTIGKAVGTRLTQLANGHEVRAVSRTSRDKSISSEHTFDVDTVDDLVVERALRGQSEGLARRLRANGLVAGQVAIKLRYEDFSTVGRSHTIPGTTDVAAEIFAVIKPLWHELRESGRAVRLVGVKVEQLHEMDRTGRQLTFDDRDESRAMAETVMDEVAAKFGSAAVISGRMLRGSEPER